MKISTIKILIITYLLITSLSCAHSGNLRNINLQEHKSLEKKGPGKIVFDKEIHNFGTLKDGEIVSYAFVFRNSGKSPFKITKVEKSCGCLDIRYRSNAIAPGDTATIEITLNTSGEWGNLIRSATIETSENERKELQVGAYIESELFNNL